MAALSITWFGHATFLLTTPGGKRIVFDPWLTGNPKTPARGEDRQGGRHLRHARAFGPLGRRRRGGARDGRAGGRRLRARELVPGQGPQGRHRHGRRRHRRREGPEDLDDAGRAHEQHRGGRQGPLRRPGHRLRRADGRQPRDLFRRRHGALRRHAADQGALRAGDRVPADRRSLHDGSRRRRRRRARCSACGRSCRCTTARSRR